MIIYFIIFLLNVISTSQENVTPQQEETITKSEGTCPLPPYPKNGYYLTDSGLTPGDVTDKYVLNVTCMKNFHLVGDKTFSCFFGLYSGSMPECLPYCDTDKKDNVVTCDAGTLRCVLDPSDKPGVRTLPIQDNECGVLSIATSNIVAGGHKADFDELPWHAGIYKKTTSPYMQICGGSLISNNVIISAAHCFWTDIEKLQPASKFAVAVGKLYRPWNNERDGYAQKSDVQEIKIPDRYRGETTKFQDDIAIVITATSFIYTQRVKPVCLSFDHQLDDLQLKDGNFGKVGGWGLTGEDAKSSQILKAVDMPYVDINKCISEGPPGFTPYITSDKICAGYQNGTAVCKGDSGGGLVFPEKSQLTVRHFLRGIVSTAPVSDHACNIYAWGTFTHVINHEHFIRRSLRGSLIEARPSRVVDEVPGVYFRNANLMNYATTKPVYQWV